MAARTVKIRHDEETRARRFYVYKLMDEQVVAYIGKGSGYRLNNQIRAYGLPGEVVATFEREKDAYAFEIKAIAELKPLLNRHKGGNGPRCKPFRKPRKPVWLIEIERIGTRAYAARLLLKFSQPDVEMKQKLQGIAYS